MDTERRVALYGGPWKLTPAQRRRAAKKDRAAKQRPAAYVLIESTLRGDRFAMLDNRLGG